MNRIRLAWQAARWVAGYSAAFGLTNLPYWIDVLVQFFCELFPAAETVADAEQEAFEAADWTVDFGEFSRGDRFSGR